MPHRYHLWLNCRFDIDHPCARSEIRYALDEVLHGLVSRTSFWIIGLAWPPSVGAGSIADACAGSGLEHFEEKPSTPDDACEELAKDRMTLATAAITSS